MSRPLQPPRPLDKKQERLTYFGVPKGKPLPRCKCCGNTTANFKTLICQPCKEQTS